MQLFCHNTGIMKVTRVLSSYDDLTRAEMARIITACKDTIDLQASAN